MEPDEKLAADISSLPKKSIDSSLEKRLVMMSEKGNMTLVYKILKTKLVFVDATDDLSNTSLIYACKGGHFEIAQMLIEAGADVNFANSLKITPLHLAARYDRVSVVKLLVLAGARLDARTREGLRPVDFAAYDSQTWSVLNQASLGELPEIEEINDVPEIPDYAVERATGQKKKKRGKKGGKKKGGKKGGKKKGKKKKK